MFTLRQTLGSLCLVTFRLHPTCLFPSLIFLAIFYFNNLDQEYDSMQTCVSSQWITVSRGAVMGTRDPHEYVILIISFTYYW